MFRMRLRVAVVLSMLVGLIPAIAAPAGAAPADDLVITGVVDGPLSGGLPKAIEVLAVNAIPDLSIYGLGSANNGGGSDGEEFTFPADSAAAGDYLYVASEAPGFTAFFGFAPDYTSGAANINGDDAIELFANGTVSDVFGDINVDGTGEPWEHLDGWASRKAGTGPDGSTFTIANWTFSGPNALDGETSNATASTPFPLGRVIPRPPIVINEVDADTPGSDAAEFVELYDGGVGNTALDGLTVVFYNGNGDASYAAYDLDGLTTSGDGYLVLGNAAVSNVDVVFGGNGLQNGADAVAIYEADATDFPNGTAVTTTGLEDAVVYDTNDSDDAGLLVLLNAAQPQVNEDDNGDKDNHSNQRCPNGEGGQRNTDTFDQFPPTPGAANTCGVVVSTNVLINEVDADNSGADSAEFVELYDGGAGNTDLTGLSVVFVNGSDDLSYLAFDLDGETTDAGGYFVLGNPGVPNVDVEFSPGSFGALQNGADAVALVIGDAADYPNDTPVAVTDVLDAVVYDTNDSDDAGLLPLLNAGQPQVNEDGNGDKDNHSNQRCPNGEGGQRNTDTYDQFEPSPGASNLCGRVLSPLVINEVDADTPGSDAAEFVELFDGGVGNTDLTGHSIVFYNGSDDASYAAFDLDGQTTDANGYFVIGNSGVPNVDIVFSGNGLQNGADAVALVEGDAADYPNDTPVGVIGLIDAIVYDTNDSDDAGLLGVLTPGQPQVNEGGFGDKDGHSNQRCFNGSGGALNTGSYQQWAPTPGAGNFCDPVPPAEMFIHEIQGSGAVSPVDGSWVIVEGVVVGDFQDTDLNGFWLQEEDADADGNPDTSDGILVFEGVSTVEVGMGDTVKVVGRAIEFFDVTEITNVLSVEVTGVGVMPTPVTLSFPVASTDFESIEGMSVVVPQTMTITEYFNFDRFGEVAIATERQAQPTAVFDPGTTDAADLADLNRRSRITLDDGWTGQNVDPARHPNGGVFDLTNRFRGGDTVANVVGVMHDSFGYRIHPTAGADYTAANPRPASPDDVGGDITVAAFNVLNYFSTLDGSGSICGPLSDQGCRGADNAEEFTRQRDKIISAIATMDADVVGLIEIENHVDDDAVKDLIAGLDVAMGAGTYDYVAAGPTGPDVIKVAFIYKPATISLAGAHAVLDTPGFLDPNGVGRDLNRAALAQTFVENATGEAVTVVVNHFKSKGSGCGAGDDDPEAGSCNLSRTLAAQALATWLAGDPTNSGDPDVLIIGDLNSYDKEDPIDALKAAGYSDLVHESLGEDAYSFVFSGQWGYLDYAMSNASLDKRVTGTTIWHTNADEPDILDYNTDFKRDAQDALYEPNAFRASDHDAVIVGLNLADPMGDTEDIVDDLEDLRAGANTATTKRLNKAIAALNQSLWAGWWTSDQTIIAKKVFDKHRIAVAQLSLIVSSGFSQADDAEAAIAVLLNADRQLAQIELIAAIDRSGDAAKIAESTAAMADAAAFVGAGLYVDAVNAYKAAWDAARKA